MSDDTICVIMSVSISQYIVYVSASGENAEIISFDEFDKKHPHTPLYHLSRDVPDIRPSEPRNNYLNDAPLLSDSLAAGYLTRGSNRK